MHPLRLANTAFITAAAATPLLWYLGYIAPLWQTAWYALVILMLIRPLADLGLPFLRRYLLLRQGLGILSSTIIVTNLAFALTRDPLLLFTLSSWDSPLALTSRIAELTALLLLITSNTFSQRLLKKNWKRIQRLSYVYLITAAFMHFRFHPMQYDIPILTALILLLTLAAFLKKRCFAPARSTPPPQ